MVQSLGPPFTLQIFPSYRGQLIVLQEPKLPVQGRRCADTDPLPLRRRCLNQSTDRCKAGNAKTTSEQSGAELMSAV